MKSQPSLRSHLHVLLALMLAIGFTSASHAAQEDKIFRFNVSPSGYPPYLIVNGTRPTGIIWDVVSLISERMGYTLTPEKIPRKRVDQMLLDGYVDGTARAKQWTEHPEDYLFTDPIVHIEEVFFTPRASGAQYETPDDLISKTLVTRLGYHYPALSPYFDKGLIRRFDASRDREMFIFTLHGSRFDAAVADRLVGQWFMRNEGLRDKLTISENSISQYGFRIMLRKDWKPFAEAFNKELARIRNNGELDAILANYR
jgi:polar amino acid transport system substrate-binding protein